MDVNILDGLAAIIPFLGYFKKILDAQKLKKLMRERIFMDVEPKYERLEKDLEDLNNEIVRFGEENYPCKLFQEEIVNVAQRVGLNARDFILSIVEAYRRDRNTFFNVVKNRTNNDIFYLLVEKWADVLGSNKNATLGELLISSLDIVVSNYGKDKLEKDIRDSTLKFLVAFQDKQQKNEVTEEDIQNKVMCLIEIQPKLLEVLGFSGEDLEKGYLILGVKEWMENLIKEVFNEMERRIDDDSE